MGGLVDDFIAATASRDERNRNDRRQLNRPADLPRRQLAATQARTANAERQLRTLDRRQAMTVASDTALTRQLNLAPQQVMRDGSIVSPLINPETRRTAAEEENPDMSVEAARLRALPRRVARGAMLAPWAFASAPLGQEAARDIEEMRQTRHTRPLPALPSITVTAPRPKPSLQRTVNHLREDAGAVANTLGQVGQTVADVVPQLPQMTADMIGGHARGAIGGLEAAGAAEERGDLSGIRSNVTSGYGNAALLGTDAFLVKDLAALGGKALLSGGRATANAARPVVARARDAIGEVGIRRAPAQLTQDQQLALRTVRGPAPVAPSMERAAAERDLRPLNQLPALSIGHRPADVRDMLARRTEAADAAAGTARMTPQRGVMLGARDHANWQPYIDEATGEPLIDPETGKRIMVRYGDGGRDLPVIAREGDEAFADAASGPPVEGANYNAGTRTRYEPDNAPSVADAPRTSFPANDVRGARPALPQRAGNPVRDEVGIGAGPSNPLDMSTEARMARAREQGWSVENPVYRGMTQPMDGPELRATTTKGGPWTAQGPGVSTSRLPEQANGWADADPGATVYPLLTRGGLADGFAFQDEVIRRVKAAGGPITNQRLIDEASALQREYRRDGFTGLKFTDEVRIFPDEDGRVTNIRSVHAAFDPTRSDSADLMAFASPNGNRTQAGALTPRELQGARDPLAPVPRNPVRDEVGIGADGSGTGKFHDPRLTADQSYIVARRREGADNATIADEMGISPNAVAQQVTRARARAPDIDIRPERMGRKTGVAADGSRIHTPAELLAMQRKMMSSGMGVREANAAIRERIGRDNNWLNVQLHNARKAEAANASGATPNLAPLALGIGGSMLVGAGEDARAEEYVDEGPMKGAPIGRPTELPPGAKYMGATSDQVISVRDDATGKTRDLRVLSFSLPDGSIFEQAYARNETTGGLDPVGIPGVPQNDDMPAQYYPPGYTSPDQAEKPSGGSKAALGALAGGALLAVLGRGPYARQFALTAGRRAASQRVAASEYLASLGRPRMSLNPRTGILTSVPPPKPNLPQVAAAQRALTLRPAEVEARALRTSREVGTVVGGGLGAGSGALAAGAKPDEAAGYGAMGLVLPHVAIGAARTLPKGAADYFKRMGPEAREVRDYLRGRQPERMTAAEARRSMPDGERYVSAPSRRPVRPHVVVRPNEAQPMVPRGRQPPPRKPRAPVDQLKSPGARMGPAAERIKAARDLTGQTYATGKDAERGMLAWARMSPENMEKLRKMFPAMAVSLGVGGAVSVQRGSGSQAPQERQRQR